MDKNQKTAQESPILGKQSVSLKKPVYIIESASVVGKKEGEGPLGELFDLVGEDDMFGGQTWEDAESTLQKEALGTALGKAGWKAEEVRYLFAGDLLGQEIATSFGLVSFEIPLFGLYGACSTCGLSLTLASLVISGGFAEKAACVTSSHFASAEKEFRFNAVQYCIFPGQLNRFRRNIDPCNVSSLTQPGQGNSDTTASTPDVEQAVARLEPFSHPSDQFFGFRTWD